MMGRAFKMGITDVTVEATATEMVYKPDLTASSRQNPSLWDRIGRRLPMMAPSPTIT